LFLEETIKAENGQNLLTQLFAMLEENIWDSWFQQDEVTTRTAKTTKAFLQDLISDHIVGYGVWPPQFPDLMPSDFFLEGLLQERVFSSNPRSLQDLIKWNINQPTHQDVTGTL
jgi:hypothetical protein